MAKKQALPQARGGNRSLGPLALAGLRPASLAALKADRCVLKRVQSRERSAGVRQNDGQSERFHRVPAWQRAEAGRKCGNKHSPCASAGGNSVGRSRSWNASVSD